MCMCVCVCVCAGGPSDKGLAAMPGREADFKTTLSVALDYAVALDCPR